MSKPKYDWGRLLSGVEQIHEILKLLIGLYEVGSTNPVADAATLGRDEVLREAIAKTLLDLIICPIAISLDRRQALMRVRRHMEPDEIAVWLRRRGYRIATNNELRQFLTESQFWGVIIDLSESTSSSGQPRYSEFGYSAEKGVHERASGSDSIDCYMPDIGFILTVRDGDHVNLDPVVQGFPTEARSLGQCQRCGGDVSGWTHECPRCGVVAYWPKN